MNNIKQEKLLVGNFPYCDFSTIKEAVDFSEKQEKQVPCTITILEGVYEERVVIKRSNLTLKGMGNVVLTNALGAREKDENGLELGTFRTATLFVGGIQNMIENLTVENTAGCGEIAGQALAVYADCDESVFKKCRFLGYQDTLFTGPLPPKQKDGTDFFSPEHKNLKNKYRQYYVDCVIAGSIDFIFGGATAIFQRCEIRSRKEKIRSGGYITAASTPKESKIGFIFQHCWLTAEEGVEQVYLGRPWRPYAKTYFVDCEYGQHIHPEGWNDWSNEKNRQTVDYREYFRNENGYSEGSERASWSKQFIQEADSKEWFAIFENQFFKNASRNEG
ncbi:pectinesterase family protein [Jeotgalibaca sp. MA1X17-3]|uniref:pectinesterase family protein n=1 Tax=Jeotgalibaca sp. MA1X17-3 TaxID=2908211 RepID=UPI001F37A1A1|nr:pectinesterase family protein [Jeotgalibaca sp. MA1X17-3]UJF15664.1 pectinesterase family protein [Jeotgalibaca sp. MA1X17-3]